MDGVGGDEGGVPKLQRVFIQDIQHLIPEEDYTCANRIMQSINRTQYMIKLCGIEREMRMWYRLLCHDHVDMWSPLVYCVLEQADVV